MNKSLFSGTHYTSVNNHNKELSIIYFRSSREWGQLVIFPEGATSNRKAILNFKPGGFIPGVPVQPIVIKYPNTHDTISWTWDQPHGVIGCVLYSMTQVIQGNPRNCPVPVFVGL